ncbi:hypothetical protein BX616_003913 [Lobosporangium transversale]|nr:hypothetical protein BX616_003913 [Lobosporangium transversale]
MSRSIEVRCSFTCFCLTRDASELQPHEKRQKVAANQPILSVRQAQQTVDVHEPGERAHWATPATTAGPFRPSADSYLDRGGSPSPPSSPVFAYDEHLKHWSSCETKSLHRLVEQYGEDDWHSVASRMPGRSTQSCKLRWVRYKAEKQRQQQHTSSDVVAFPRGQSKGKERASDRFADPLFTLAAAATVIENLPPNMIITMAPPTAPALIEARAKDATMAPTMTPPTVSSMVSGVASNLIAASTKEMPKDVAIIPFSHPTMIQTVPLPPIENSGTSLAISPAKGPAANSDLVAVIEALPGPSTGPSIQKSLQSTGRQPDQGSRPKKHNAASGRWRAGEDKALMEGVNAYLASRGLEAQPPAHLPTEQELQLQKRQLQEEQNQRDATTILAAIQRQGANAYPITSVQNQPAYTMQQTHQYQHQHLQQQHLMLQRSQQSQQPQLLHQQQQLMLQLELHHYQQLQLHAQYQAQQRIQLLAQYQQPWSGSGLGPAEEAELFNSMVDLSYKASNGNGGLGNEAANAVESSPSSLGSLTAAVSAQDTSSNTSTRTGTTVVGSRIYRNMRSSHYVHNDDEYYSSASSYQSLSNTPISIASASSSNNASVNPSSGSGAKCDTDLAEALCEALSMAGEPRQFYSPQEVNGTSCEQSPHLVARSSSNDLTQPFVETRDDNQVPQQAHQDYYKEYQTQGYHLRYDGGFHTTAASPFLPATKVLANHQSTPAANPQAIVSEGIPTPSTGLLLEQQFMLPQSDNISATGSTLYFDNASQAMATYSVEHQNQASSNTLVFSHAASAIPFHRAQMNSQLATVESNHNGSNMPREPDRNEEMVNIEVKLPLMSNDTSQDMNALNQQQQNQEWHHHPLGPWLDADGGDNDKNGDTGLSDDDFIWNWDWTFLDGEKGGSLTPWTHTGLDYILGLEKLDPSLIPYPQAQAHSGTLCDSQPPLIADPAAAAAAGPTTGYATQN